MDSAGTQPAVVTVSEPEISPQQRWTELGLVFLVAIAPVILSATALLLYPRTGPPILPNFRMAGGLLHQISSLLLLIYLLRRRGVGLSSLGLKFNDWRDILRGLGLAFAALLISSILSLFDYWSTQGSAGQAAKLYDPRVIFAGVSPSLMLVYAAGASFFEEIIVRGYVTTELIGLSSPVWLATMASVLLQTSYHVYYGFHGAIVASGTFIIFGFYFAVSRRLLPVILGHLFFDVIAIGFNHF